MPGPLANLVLERANAPGTAATINLGGAPSGWTGFVAAVGNGGTAYYFISDGVQSEWGHATVAAGAINTLTRGVIGNTQSTAARLNFTGAVDVWCSLPAERTPFFDGADATLPMGGRRLAALGAGTAAGDAPRLDQVGWRALQTTVVSASASGVGFTLPAGFARFRVEFNSLTPGAASSLLLRYSADGATYYAGASDYGWAAADIKLAGVAATGGASSAIELAPTSAGNLAGWVEFETINSKATLFDCFVTGTLTRRCGTGYGTFTAPITTAGLAFAGSNIAAGRLRLLGGF